MTTPANQALIDSWRLSLHDKRPRTVGVYVEEVTRFASDTEADLSTVERRDVEKWFTTLRERGLSSSTMRARWIALRSFYAWALDEEEVTVNPMAKVKVARPDPAPVDVLDAEDLAKLLKVCQGSDFIHRRDLALIRLLASTGLRASECVGLMVADLDLANRLVVVRHGKGDRQRVVRFDPATGAALDRYKRTRARHRLAHGPELWLAHTGPLTRKGVGPVIDRRAAEAGIGHIHPHQLRHTWASNWLAAGGQEGDLQKLGGWENSDVMRRYGAAAAVDRALAAYDSVNPMGKL
jgi:site-specific recombinase XerD